MRITCLICILLCGFTLALPAKKGPPAIGKNRQIGLSDGVTEGTTGKKKIVVEPKRVFSPEGEAPNSVGTSDNELDRAQTEETTSSKRKTVETRKRGPDSGAARQVQKEVNEEDSGSKRKVIDDASRKRVTEPEEAEKEGDMTAGRARAPVEKKRVYDPEMEGRQSGGDTDVDETESAGRQRAKSDPKKVYGGMSKDKAMAREDYTTTPKPLFSWNPFKGLLGRFRGFQIGVPEKVSSFFSRFRF